MMRPIHALLLVLALLLAVCTPMSALSLPSDDILRALEGSDMATSTATSTAARSAQVTRMHRWLEGGSGFHRTLVTKFTIEGDSVKTHEADACRLLLRESLPREFYFDLYELRQLARFRQTRSGEEAKNGLAGEVPFEVYSPDGDIELERSAEASRSYTVWFAIDRPQWSTLPLDDGSTRPWLATTIRVPIHARYQAASRNGSSSRAIATMPPPEIFLSCMPSEESANQASQWLHLAYYRSGPGAETSMEVPIGDLTQLSLVRLGTFVVTMATALSLCILVWWQAKRRAVENSTRHRD